MKKEIQHMIDIVVKLTVRILPNTKAIYLFGSYADGTYREDSDLDIAVHMKEAIKGMQKLELMTAFVKELDVVVDLVDFKQVGTVLQYEIVTKGKVIFDGDEEFNQNTYLKTLGIYHDYIIETRELMEAIKKEGRVYG